MSRWIFVSAALALAAWLRPWAPARAGSDAAEQLRNLRYNMHNAFLRSYLHMNRTKLKPAPGWMRHIGAKIGREARLGMGVSFHFYLVDLPEANATATPHGTIIVHQGMLDMGLTREEIGALMAHEVAHLRRDHAIQRLVRSIEAAQLAVYQARKHGAKSAQLSHLMRSIQNLQFNRAEELEADHLGMALLEKAGYDPAAMVGLLEKLHQHLQQKPPKERPRPYLSSHPPTGDRIEAARRILAVSGRPARASDKPRSGFSGASPLSVPALGDRIGRPRAGPPRSEPPALSEPPAEPEPEEAPEQKIPLLR